MSDDAPGPDLAAGYEVSLLPEGRMVAGSVDGKPVVLINEGGRYCAWSGSCTHMNAPLGEGLLIDGQIRCPWHHARFSTATGEAVGAPAFEALTPFATSLKGGRVYVAPVVAAPAAVASSALRPGGGASPRVIIIGAGAAGHACAELLGRSGFPGTVSVVSDDADAPYDRTVCSKQYLSGSLSRVESALPPTSQATRHAGRAQAIDVTQRRVHLDTGERLPYDVLVLATGAVPVRPELPGFDAPNVHVLRTLRDADAVIAAAAGAKRAAVIGASFIGLEAAAALTQRGVEVHVVAPDEIPLQKLVGAQVGAMIKTVHEEKGVVFHPGRKPRSFDGGSLALDDGSALDVDFIVVGVGVHPATQLAEGAGIACAAASEGGGVEVNERLETSVPGIYAIGDVARYPDVYAGRPIRVEHWVHAQRQGQHVARAIMGQGGRFRDLPFFWSAHFDTGLRYHGHAESIRGTVLDGSIEGRDFTIEYRGDAPEKAFVTCNRDLPALVVEAEWEGAEPDLRVSD